MNLADKSYAYIRKQLFSGVFQPGSRLVNRTLAGEIGVSVIPVREALNRLASEGLVDQIAGEGVFVRVVDCDELDQMYVLRDALESCAASEAAAQRTVEHLLRLEASLAEAWEIAGEILSSSNGHATHQQFDRWLENELQFHALLIEAAQNKLLARVINEQRAICEVFESQRNRPEILTVEIAKLTCEGKAELVQAIEAGDAERARQLVSAQIQRGRRFMLAFLRSESENGLDCR